MNLVPLKIILLTVYFCWRVCLRELFFSISKRVQVSSKAARKVSNYTFSLKARLKGKNINTIKDCVRKNFLIYAILIKMKLVLSSFGYLNFFETARISLSRLALSYIHQDPQQTPKQ